MGAFIGDPKENITYIAPSRALARRAIANYLTGVRDLPANPPKKTPHTRWGACFGDPLAEKLASIFDEFKRWQLLIGYEPVFKH